MKPIQVLAGALFLLGCSHLSSYAAPATPNDAPPPPPADPQSIPIYEGLSTPQNYTIVGPVEATSCKQGLFNASPVREKAIAEIRAQAFQKGANAIGNMNCVEQTMSGDCFSAIICTGTAINVSATPVAAPAVGSANPFPSPIGKNCAAIKTATERLACYDGDAKRRR